MFFAIARWGSATNPGHFQMTSTIFLGRFLVDNLGKRRETAEIFRTGAKVSGRQMGQIRIESGTANTAEHRKNQTMEKENVQDLLKKFTSLNKFR